MSKVRFLKSALDDMDEIIAYIAGDSKEAAVSIHDELMEKAKKLERFPKMGQLVSEEKMRLQGYRFIVCSAYLIFYREINETIFVYRVLHGRRDYSALFDLGENG